MSEKAKLRVALLSFWHVHAKDYAKQVMEHTDTELVAIWDEIPERGRREAEGRGIRYVEQLGELLSDSHIDGVIVTAPTADHMDIMTAAAEAGKHIFTEKVIALTSAECDKIMAAVNRSGVVLTVSLPRLNTPFTQGALALAACGLLGELTSVRARLSHSGALPAEDNPLGYLPAHFFDPAQTGGGAMIDLGCHPMILVRLFLGMPESVSASYSCVTGKAVEDNAITVLRYKNGAFGVVEAGFVNRSSPFTLELHGTEGSALYHAYDAKLIYRSLKLEGDAAGRWHTFKLPAALPSSFDQWVSHIRNGTKATENVTLALDLTRLMEAASISAKSGAAVQLLC
ncbi:Gfo/Idh/MocA family protein [Paenibacillus tarimensis]